MKLFKSIVKTKIPDILFAAVGLLLIGTAWYTFAKPGSWRSEIKYNADDIVYDQPLHAVHEMGLVTINLIIFSQKGGQYPKIAVSEKFHDFGKVDPSVVATHEFIIMNQGDAPLTISRAYTTCGCTTADFTGSVVPPGKVSIVTMVLDTGFHDMRGQTVRRGVIIENNDPMNPQAELWVQASVRNNP